MRSRTLALALALWASRFASAFAGIVCPDSMYAYATFATTKDRITIAPGDRGESLAENGITVEVVLKNCNGVPIVGVPAEEILIFNSALCLCQGGYMADGPTDQNGRTRFTGRISGGGCVEHLTVFAEGVAIATVPVKTNSTDHVPASPCHVDAADLSAFASRLGNPDRYSICFDYNETGPPTINAGDLSYFAHVLGAACQ